MDKTSGHTGHDNFEKYEEGFEIEFTFQPPNSPDLNINDLTFFNSLDSMVCHMKDNAHDMLGLIDCVTEAFDAYDSAKIDSGFGHLFAVFRKILEHRCGNKSRSPHDHVCENIAAGRSLNFVNMTVEQINELSSKMT